MNNSLIFNRLKSEIDKFNLLVKEIDNASFTSNNTIKKIELSSNDIDREDIKILYVQNARFLMLSSEIQCTLSKMTVLKELLGKDWDSEENTLDNKDKKQIEILTGSEVPVFYVDKEGLKINSPFSSELTGSAIESKIPHDKEELKKIADTFLKEYHKNQTRP